jgi:hypothetical protein
METAELKNHLDQTLQIIETLESQIQFFKTENQKLNIEERCQIFGNKNNQEFLKFDDE